MKEKINQTLVAVLTVTGIIAIVTISLNYPGRVELKVGADGLHLQITGVEDIKRLR